MDHLVWAFGRHVNRSIENLASAFETAGFEVIPWSLQVPRWRKLWPMLSTLHLDRRGRLRGYSSIHPSVTRLRPVTGDLRHYPVFVPIEDAIVSDAPHFFYQDLNYGSVLDFRKRRVQTFMFDDIPMRLLEKRWRAQQEHYARVDLVFTMSDWVRDRIIRLDGLSPDRVHTVGAGSNLGHRWTENPYGEENARARRALFIGRDWVRKGGRLLLEAWAEVHRAVPDAELVMVGPGPELSDAGRHIRSHGPLPSEELRNLMRECTLFVLPTLFEAYGIIFIEAMSAGLPVVGPRRMAVPEMVVDGTTGYLVDGDDVGAYAERLIALLGAPERARAMSQAAFERSREFTWEQVQKRMEAVMRPVLASRLPREGAIPHG